jgi:hypothetical protein
MRYVNPTYLIFYLIVAIDILEELWSYTSFTAVELHDAKDSVETILGSYTSFTAVELHVILCESTQLQ